MLGLSLSACPTEWCGPSAHCDEWADDERGPGTGVPLSTGQTPACV